MESCSVCFTELTNANRAENDCGCDVCSDCAIKWAFTQLESSEGLSCPDCKWPVDVARVEAGMSPKQRRRLAEIQLKFYLRRTNDVVYCPRCRYAGFRPLKCYSLDCPSCLKEWDVEPDFVSVGRKISDWTSEAWKMAYTKECPTCLSSIEKNEGCSHMTCGRCSSSFCWDCMQKYRFHSNKRCHTNMGPVALFLCSVFALVLGIVKIHTVASGISASTILLDLVFIGLFIGAWSVPAFAALYKFKVMKERSIVLEAMAGVSIVAMQAVMFLGLYWLEVPFFSVYSAGTATACGSLCLGVYNLAFKPPSID